LKCAPSKGARHPFDAYLLDAAGVIYEPGQYYYCPKRHRLYGVDSNKTPEISPDKDKSIRLYLLINFERYQWRYRHSWAYKDIFFDLGHIVEIIQSVAKNIGLDICPIAFDGVSPFDKVLKDECLFTCEVKI
jgi:hypothetical protein